jgi:hypothetical protein
MNQFERSDTWRTVNNDGAIPRLQLDFNSFGELHKLVCLKSKPTPGNSRFASHLALYFPDVAAMMDEGDFGILHLEIGVLKLATLDAITRRDWETVRKHFTFIADLFEHSGTELCDALEISYLGNLLYGETSINYAKARSLLPRPLAIALEKIERHYEDLSS